MKNIRICLLASIGVLLGYLGGVFIFAGFDITQWATADRASREHAHGWRGWSWGGEF